MDDKEAMRNLTLDAEQWRDRVDRQLIALELSLQNLAVMLKILMKSREMESPNVERP